MLGGAGRIKHFESLRLPDLRDAPDGSVDRFFLSITLSSW